jgi:hypothetical protein
MNCMEQIVRVKIKLKTCHVFQQTKKLKGLALSIFIWIIYKKLILKFQHKSILS